MIDDEFETVFRRMIEHLMGAIGQFHDGNTTIRYWTSSNFDLPNEVEDAPIEDESDAEIIDLDEKVLVIANLGNTGFVPSVRVEGKKLIVENEIDDKDMILDLDFYVDVNNSHASYKNGVLEVELKKAEDGSDVVSEGYLNYELRG